MFVVDVLSVLVALVVTVICYCKWKYQYWQKKNVPYLKPSIPFGNLGTVIRGKEVIGFRFKRIYDEMKENGWKHGGIYIGLTPNYVVVDLDYVKNILMKDFQNFMDHNFYFNEEDDPLSAHLVALTGDRWKDIRTKLTPNFTSHKMKIMFQTLLECEDSLRKQVEILCDKKEGINIKEVFARFGTDVIGSVVFGLDCKSLENENSPFRIYSKKFERAGYALLKNIFVRNFPNVARKLHVTVTPKEVTNFFLNLVKDVVEYREKNNYIRNDFIQLLIDIKNEKIVGDDGVKRDGLTMKEITAQSFLFFVAGLESSSELMTFALYELSRHQHIQQRLRNEINEVLEKHDGKTTYDSIQDMKYMNQIINETLRMYPPVPVTGRICTKDYKVPNENIIIEKGTSVLIPIMGIHYDEEYYPNPKKFDPDRFSEKNSNSQQHFTHLPFGEGPRGCIGKRFALMQSKVALVTLIKNFNFTVNQLTKEPLQMKSQALFLSVEGGVWLNAQKV